MPFILKRVVAKVAKALRGRRVSAPWVMEQVLEELRECGEIVRRYG